MRLACIAGIVSILISTLGSAQVAQTAIASPLEPQPGAIQKTIDTCTACHGVNGRSVSPTFPNLAAQSASYLEAQLHAFKNQTRADPDAQAYMWGMASQLNDGSISALATYFSKQAPAQGVSGHATLIARGKQVYTEGVPAQQITPCVSCHGSHAEGSGPFPRLAAQHAPYLLKQLLVIQSALRTAPVMHGIIKDLNREQMEAVAAYLESI